MRPIVTLTLTMAAVATLAACAEAAPDLDTRTYRLENLSANDAEQIIGPYVYGDREGAPGMIRTSNNMQTITVRETPDNLAKIARVLEEYDEGPRPSVRLRFQVVEADGAQEVDPTIQDVEEELRRLFRYEGYRLLAQGTMQAHADAPFRQFLGRAEDGNVAYFVEGHIYEARSTPEGTKFTMQVSLDVGLPLLSTAIDIGEDQAVVLGTAHPYREDGALILVVRAESAG